MAPTPEQLAEMRRRGGDRRDGIAEDAMCDRHYRDGYMQAWREWREMVSTVLPTRETDIARMEHNRERIEKRGELR